MSHQRVVIVGGVAVGASAAALDKLSAECGSTDGCDKILPGFRASPRNEL